MFFFYNRITLFIVTCLFIVNRYAFRAPPIMVPQSVQENASEGILDALSEKVSLADVESSPLKRKLTVSATVSDVRYFLNITGTFTV